jgi:hypothetical protein
MNHGRRVGFGGALGVGVTLGAGVGDAMFAGGAFLSGKFLKFFVREVTPIRENGVHCRARGCSHVCVECEEFAFAS